ncbi:GNAT family N-acetyltransferase [Cohaesibacter haloalkalitolerans]|uniref:GNAT family N-acetyltransferase n=1 Tax=Cohaesibacter haloalkalitolerans TaxID=1162980 RepID=UPI000E65AC69|nr:GNAT family N-acetyltransferase [Cohaesibacter haloalkalitolerans]
MTLNPIKHAPGDAALGEILALIHEAFAYMDGRIDPPSSMHHLTVEDIARQCEIGEVWSIGSPVKACVFLTGKPDCLYLGKMAVSADARGDGLGRALVKIAEQRAEGLGYTALELQTRIELVENHRIFAALGFVKTLETAHPGYNRPTSITMRKPVGQAH